MYSILIIEDDPQYRSKMELILLTEGFEVRTASDGKSGLAMLHETRPDLILCDIMMPGMDGYSVLELLKADNICADVPFIFVTAKVDRADVRRGMSSGADDYLTKPFSVEELLAAVTVRILRHKTIHNYRDKAATQSEQAILRNTITPREIEILQMVGQGDTSKGIAARLGISLKTVEAHRSNLMDKLGASNAANLARWAIVAQQLKGDVD